MGQVAAEIGKSRAQVALNWCITKPGVVTIVKAESIEHVVEDCEASGWRLTPEQVQLLDEHIKFRKRSPLETMSRRFVQRLVQMTGRHLELTTPSGLPGLGSLSQANTQGKALEESHGKWGS